MSRSHKIQKSGLTLFAALGWITAAVLIFDESQAETQFESINTALIQSLVERRTLSQELERVTAKFDAAQQRLSVFENQIAEPKSRLDGLPDHVRQKLLAGAVAKYITKTRAMLRSGPSTQSLELAILLPKTPIEVLGVAPDGQWLEVARVGYVHYDLLRPVP